MYLPVSGAGEERRKNVFAIVSHNQIHYCASREKIQDFSLRSVALLPEDREMLRSLSSHADFVHLWEVFLLFLIPVGGGIPGGVVLAQKYNIAWPVMTLLYFISDLVLACVFEPMLLLFSRISRNSPRLLRFREAFKKSMSRTISQYGIKPRPFSLVMITFGTDPMTGRSVAFAAGHGFFSGWALVIMGDMLFYFVLMASTIWLNNILGNGTWTAIIITLAVLVTPSFVRRIRKRYGLEK